MISRPLLRASSVLALASAALAAPAQSYHVTDLGTLGGTASYGGGVNDFGQVTGTSYIASGAEHTFLTGPNGSAMEDLGTISGLPVSVGINVNDAGQVTGNAQTANESVSSVFLSAPNGGALNYISQPNGGSVAHGLNASGQISGTYQEDSIHYQQAFVTGPNGSAFTLLGTLGGNYSTGGGVDDSGQVTGTSSTASGYQHAFLSASNGGGLKDLGTRGGTYSSGNAVNNSGQVTGVSATTSGAEHIFLSGPNGGPLRDIGTLGASSSPDAVNDLGQVVGDYNPVGTQSFRAFLYTATGGMTDLNSLLDASGAGWTLTSATGISKTGFISGDGTINGQEHAFLLSLDPTPEPASFAALGLGALALLRHRRR